MADVIYIDVGEGTKRVMNNTKLYAKLLTKFKEDPSLGEAEAALAAKETEKAQHAAHTLKGLSANLSLTELYKQTLELETQIKSGNVDQNQLALVKEIYAKTIIEVDKVISEYA